MKIKSSDSVGAFFLAYLWLKENEKSGYEENIAFLERIGIPEHRHIYVSKTTPTVIALVRKEDLMRAEKDPAFSDYSRYESEIPKKSAEDILLTQIGADSVTGTNSPLFNSGAGYSGNGVSVGVIAAENLIFDEAAKSLEGVEIAVLSSLLPPRRDSHPTAVVSQLVGKRITVGDTEYFGTVQNATLYFASTRTARDVYRAVEEMTAQGVRVINYSAGIVKGGYSDFDRQIDRLIRAGDFLFVTVSGNTRELASPGRAENAVAAGNLVTKDYPDTPLDIPWNVWCKSADDCSGFDSEGVHKPDLVAPGAWIGYADGMGEMNFLNFGTSFACPWVSGIATALVEASESKYSYLTIKGALLMSCDGENVSRSGNDEIAPYIRLRSGYGLLNGVRAIEIMQNAEIFEGVLGDESEYEVEGGDIEVMLVYERDGESASLRLDGEEFSSKSQNTLLVKKRSTKSVSSLSVVGNGGRFSLIVFRQP